MSLPNPSTEGHNTGTDAKLDKLHPITAAVLADKGGEKHRYTEDIFDALNERAEAILASIDDVEAHAAAAGPDPFYVLGNEIRIVAERIKHALFEDIFPYHHHDNRSFPSDSSEPHLKRVDDAFDAIMDALTELSCDHRRLWLAGLLDHVKPAQTADDAAGLDEAPDTFDTSGEEATGAPARPREQTLQVAIPGVGQLLPGEMQACWTHGWQGGRDILHLSITPEQFKALGIKIIRSSKHERKELAKAGYTR